MEVQTMTTEQSSTYKADTESETISTSDNKRSERQLMPLTWTATDMVDTEYAWN